MKTTQLNTIKVIGISVRTTNENGQAGQDIPALWQKFMGEGIIEKIPNKVNGTIYSIYTDYESDHTKPYTTILGCEVSNLDVIPEGMVATTIEAGNYATSTAKGNLEHGVVYQEWAKIWNTDLNRKYTTDFEIYGEKAQDMANAEVDIFVAVN